MTTEQWRPIPGFEGYEVSDLGRVRSYRKPYGLGGWQLSDKPQRILRPGLSNGYPYVQLRRDGKSILRRVHVLVMLAFVGPVAAGQEVCHCDSDKTNNRLSNLRYDDHTGNMADAVERGVVGGRRKFSDEEVIAIRKARAGGQQIRSLAKRWDTTPSFIVQICRGAVYPDIGGPITKREENPPAPRKLSFRQAQAIRMLHTHGVSRKQLAEQYNVSISTIGLIIQGRRWADPVKEA